ncbi:hypothetical protein BIWAKO_05755 [Bosea sp. BIWAKO-01]|nr:hypothetical protein BIWAKO_05755 [Bosea sp. BIWAKO-01]
MPVDRKLGSRAIGGGACTKDTHAHGIWAFGSGDDKGRRQAGAKAGACQNAGLTAARLNPL